MGKRDLAFTEPLSGPGPDLGGEDPEFMYCPASASPQPRRTLFVEPPLLGKFILTQGMAQVHSLTPQVCLGTPPHWLVPLGPQHP